MLQDCSGTVMATEEELHGNWAVFRADPSARLNIPPQLESYDNSTGSARKGKYPELLPSVVDLRFSYPVRLFAPKHASTSQTVRWLYMMKFGGGLVEGDKVEFNVKVKDKCAALLTSTSSTKVYTCPDGQTTQLITSYSVGRDAMMAVLQDPLVAYKGAKYSQHQAIHMTGSSSFIWLDWYTAGRIANGEVWDFTSLSTMAQIFVDDQLVLQEGTTLSNTAGHGLSIRQKMGKYQVCGTFIVLGHRLSGYITYLLIKYGQRKNCDDASRDSDQVIANCSLLDASISQLPGCRLTFLCTSTIKAYDLLDTILQPILPSLGGNPFENKS